MRAMLCVMALVVRASTASGAEYSDPARMTRAAASEHCRQMRVMLRDCAERQLCETELPLTPSRYQFLVWHEAEYGMSMEAFTKACAAACEKGSPPLRARVEKAFCAPVRRAPYDARRPYRATCFWDLESSDTPEYEAACAKGGASPSRH